MYADDTSLMYKAKNASDLQIQLESCLCKVADWFKANKLTLNVDKTKFMIFGTNRTLDNTVFGQLRPKTGLRTV